MKSKIFHSFDVIVTINFIVSVMFLIAGMLLSLSDRYSLFELNADLYGEFIVNFKVTMLYVALSEFTVCIYCFFSKKTDAFMLVGLFLLLMAASIDSYSEINSIELDENLHLFFLYTGISHLLFGILSNLKKQHTTIKER